MHSLLQYVDKSSTMGCIASLRDGAKGRGAVQAILIYKNTWGANILFPLWNWLVEQLAAFEQ